jgi:hypothetical protein
LTPEEMRARAARLDAEADTVLTTDPEKASKLYQAAAVLLGAALARDALNTKRRGKVGGMTAEQKLDRAHAIAKARTKRDKDKLQKAIEASEWRTHNRYAKELGISAGMLTGYKQGVYDVPEDVNSRIEADFGIRLPLRSRK